MEDPVDKIIDNILLCLGDEFVFEGEEKIIVFEGEEKIITKHDLMFRIRPFASVSTDYVGYSFINDFTIETRLDNVRKLPNIEKVIYSSGFIIVDLNNRSSSEYVLK